MSEQKKDFMLLAVHTDKEFTHWLQHHAEEGWWLQENKGNIFVFEKQPYTGRRICSYTVSSRAFGISAEDVFYEELPDLRKNGWDLLAMGMPETLTDRTRHAFLTDIPREDLPVPEIPQSDPDSQAALLRGALRKSASTLALSLIFAGVLIYSFISRKALLFQTAAGPVFAVVSAVLVILCMYFSVRAVFHYGKAVREPFTNITSGNYRCLDKAVVLSSLMLAVLALYLIADLLL